MIKNRLTAFILVLCIPGLLWAAAGTKEIAIFCKRGDRALSNQQYDSAMVFYYKANIAGMSNDSLFFFCAEVYHAKGVLDTALALNLFIAKNVEKKFSRAILKQRFLIYSLLGWEKETAQIGDSLQQLEPVLNKFLPVYAIDTKGGYNRIEQIEPQLYPYRTPQSFNQIRSPIAAGSASLQWNVPLQNGLLNFSGLYATSSGFYLNDFYRDSINQNWGASCNLYLRNNYSFSYSIVRERNWIGELSTINNGSITFTNSEMSYGTFFISAGYSASLQAALTPNYQHFWIINNFEVPVMNTIKCSFGPRLTGFIADAKKESRLYNRMFIDDMNADTVLHYTDNSFSTVIPFPADLSMMNQLSLIREYKTAFDTTVLVLEYPENHFSFEPVIALNIALPWNITIKPSLSYRLTVYPSEYQWYSLQDIGYISLEDDGIWLALNRADSSLYFVRELDNVLSAESYEPVVFHNANRTDQDIGFEINIRLAAGNFGNFTISSFIQKHWSNLSEITPVQIPEWSYQLNAGWNVNFKFGIQ